jgi:uncharacterized membrane protein
MNLKPALTSGVSRPQQRRRMPWESIMKLLKLLYNRETAAPMLALTFASTSSVALVIARMAWTGNFRLTFLVWNLFLAWLPLIFALLAHERYQNGARQDWRFAGMAGTWLLFFPNAPYIFTDVIHLTYGPYGHFWVDLTLILICGFTGLVLGFVSLYLMQSVVARMYGRAASWFFVVAVAGLSSFGIYLGRVLRFNSWDVLIKPVKLYHGINHWASDPLASANSFAFPVLFATFLFIAYVLLYALTQLPQAQPITAPNAGSPVEA